ncbi:hypothetical protein LRP88_13271 [Fusarium phalaenopsidis]
MSDHPSQDPSSPSPSPQTASPMPLADNDTASGAASPDLPLTMSASVVLADLPRDASAALASAGSFKTDKVVCFKNAHGQLVVVYSLTPAFG